jgi:TPR repeat protein
VEGMRLAFALLPFLLAGCGELGAPKLGALPADVHAKPDARELAEHPCRYGDAVRCIARCEGGDAQGCNGAGVLFEFAERPDPLLASSFYGRACDANYGPGCDNLAWLYLRGRGVPRDPPHAMVLFMAAFDAANLACARGDGSGCLLAGEMLRDGRGVEQDDEQALAMFRRACASGDPAGCEQERIP